MIKRKLKRLELLLFVVPAALLALPFALNAFRGDKLDRTMRSMAGPDAVACGHWTRGNHQQGQLAIPKTGYPKKMHDCIVNAFKSGKPFWAREEGYFKNPHERSPGPGKWVQSVGYVGTPEGQIYTLIYRGGAWHGLTPVKKSLWINPIVETFRSGNQHLTHAPQ